MKKRYLIKITFSFLCNEKKHDLWKMKKEVPHQNKATTVWLIFLGEENRWKWRYLFLQINPLFCIIKAKAVNFSWQSFSRATEEIIHLFSQAEWCSTWVNWLIIEHKSLFIHSKLFINSIRISHLYPLRSQVVENIFDWCEFSSSLALSFYPYFNSLGGPVYTCGQFGHLPSGKEQQRIDLLTFTSAGLTAN